MTEPRDGAPDATEPVDPPNAIEPVDAPLPAPEAVTGDPDAARAEAEAAALAANEVDGDEELPIGASALDEEADEASDDFDDEADGASDVEAGEVVAPAAGATAIDDVVADRAAERRSGRTAREAREARAAAASTSIPIDPSIRVRDNASRVFVIGTVLVFALIFLNGLLLGTGGVLRPYVSPSPEPSASESVAPSASAAASASAGTSSSPVASSSIGPSGSAGPSTLASPAASLSPAPS